MYSPEYDFNNKVSKGYRFQLAHGLIMRTLDLVEKAIINNKEAESNICEMLSDKEFVNFFTSEYHKNPFILFAQIASVLKIPKISLMSYKLYRKIKSKI